MKNLIFANIIVLVIGAAIIFIPLFYIGIEFVIGMIVGMVIWQISFRAKYGFWFDGTDTKIDN